MTDGFMPLLPEKQPDGSPLAQGNDEPLERHVEGPPAQQAMPAPQAPPTVDMEDAVLGRIDKLEMTVKQYIKSNGDVQRTLIPAQKDLNQKLEGIYRLMTMSILKEVAQIYIDFFDIAKDNANVEGLLGALEDVLYNNGAEAVISEPGVQYTPRTSLPITVPTPRKELHGQVIESLRKGFLLEKQVVIRESVRVYIFDANAPVPNPDDTKMNAPEANEPETNDIEN